jgi:hypothetical protein
MWCEIHSFKWTFQLQLYCKTHTICWCDMKYTVLNELSNYDYIVRHILSVDVMWNTVLNELSNYNYNVTHILSFDVMWNTQF